MIRKNRSISQLSYIHKKIRWRQSCLKIAVSADLRETNKYFVQKNISRSDSSGYATSSPNTCLPGYAVKGYVGNIPLGNPRFLEAAADEKEKHECPYVRSHNESPNHGIFLSRTPAAREAVPSLTSYDCRRPQQV